MKFLLSFFVGLFVIISLANAGTMTVGGKRLSCPGIEVIVKNISGEGYAYIGGPMVINPRTVTPVIFYHECAHALGIDSETQADCRGVKMGRRAGHISMRDVEQACRIIRNDPSRVRYPSGKQRCQIMKQCYGN